MFNLQKTQKYIRRTMINGMRLLMSVLLITLTPFTTTLALTETTSDQTQHLNAERHSYEVKIIDHLLSKYHYKSFALNDTFSKVILDNYLKSLDPSRIFLTISDIQTIKKLENEFDDYIRNGNTSAYLSIFHIYRARVKQRIDLALERLSHDFDFNKTEFYLIDRSDSPWASSNEELDEIWRKRIKNDLINLELLEKDVDKAYDKLRKRYQRIAKRSTQIKDNEIFQLYINAFTNAIEPHTSYFSPRATKDFNINLSLSLQGIGAVLRSEDDQTTIVNILPGGPAELSGLLHANDIIIGVAQDAEGDFVDTYGWRLVDVVDLIRGEKGSTVRLSVLPAALGANSVAIEVEMIRDKIKLEGQAAKSSVINIDSSLGKSKLGVIKLSSFYTDFEARDKGEKNYRSTTRDIAKLLKELNKENIDGLIIDLRGNGGGSLPEVINVTGLFIDQGPVVQVKNSDGRLQVHQDHDQGNLYDGPLVVMVDRHSASASEIFAGAIQDYQRGLIIGETTYGKGTVQNLISLNRFVKSKYRGELGQMKITIAQYFRVNGDSTQHRGVIPDIMWPFEDDRSESGERALENALPWRHIDQSQFTASQAAPSKETMRKLARRHQQRIEKDMGFNAALKRHNILWKAQQDKTLSLNKHQREQERLGFDGELLEIENQLRRLNNKEEYTSIENMREAQEQAFNERTYSNNSSIEIDAFMSEAANILNDYRLLGASNAASSELTTASN